jgi:DNA-binding protein
MSTVRIQVRRGLASEWTIANPILAAGEMGVETNTNLFKFGNGSSTWTALVYANNSDVAIAEISQDAIDAALSMGAGLTKTYNDGSNTITITVDTDVVSTKAFATSEATLKANAAQAAAATDATTKANVAQAAAATDATTKANAAQATAIITAQDYTASAISGINNSLSDYLVVADRGLANGVASLDASAKIPQNQLPLNSLDGNIYTLGSIGADEIFSNNVTSVVLLTANDVNIGGNLTVNGTTTTVNSTNVSYQDPMIYLGDGNQSNVLDLGFVAAFNDGTYQHSGFVRDATDGIWKLFAGVTNEPGQTVDFNSYTREDLEVGRLNATSARIGDITNLEIQHLAGVNSPIQAQLYSKLEAIPANSIEAINIQNSAVTTAKIADSAVTTAKIADSAVSEIKIATDAVTTAKIANFAVSEIKIATDAVTTAKIADSAVSEIKIATDAVTTAKIADSAVSEIKIATNAVTTAKIATDAVTTAKIANLSITNDKISDMAYISTSKIDGLDNSLSLKSTIDSPTFTGNVILPSTTSIGDVSSTEIGYLDGITSSVQTQITATATNLSSHASSTTNVHGISDTSALALTATVNSALNLKAPLASPTFTGTVNGITKTMVGLGSVDNISDAAKPVSTATQTELNLKAPLASPALTGVPTAPTATAGTATTQVATTAFVGTAVSNLVASAPAALDTLNELATALGNDANFSTTLTNNLAAKAPLASPALTGTATVVNLTASGTVTLPAAGIVFSDGTQAKAGVPSVTAFATAIAASATLAAGQADKFVPLTGAVVITLPATGYATGQSVDFYQVSGTGASFASTNSAVGTPGLKFRTTNSVATAMKTSSGWLVFGDLSA